MQTSLQLSEFQGPLDPANVAASVTVHTCIPHIYILYQCSRSTPSEIVLDFAALAIATAYECSISQVSNPLSGPSGNLTTSWWLQDPGLLKTQPHWDLSKTGIMFCIFLLPLVSHGAHGLDEDLVNPEM